MDEFDPAIACRMHARCFEHRIICCILYALGSEMIREHQTDDIDDGTNSEIFGSL